MRQIPFAILIALGCLSSAMTATAKDALTQSQPTHYRITVLASLGGTTLNTRGNSINDLGLVAGYSNAPNQRRHAAAWALGRKFDLGTLGSGDDLNSGVIWPVKNDVGLVSGISQTDELDPNQEFWSCAAFIPNPGGHTCHGFVWQWGVMRDLPPLPGGYNSFATGTNNWGQTGGWAENGVHDPACVPPQVLQFKPVIWGPGRHQVHELPLISGDSAGSVTAINDRGQAVGISGTCDQAVGRSTAAHAVLWSDGGVVEIANPNGAAYWNTPMAINERGDVVGFAGQPGDFDGNFTVAFLWNRSGGFRWLPLLDGEIASTPTGINERGQVVGYSNDGATPTGFHPWIWQNGHLSNLNDLIDRSNGFAGQLVLAGDINTAGVITGRALDADGNRIAFIATPIRH